jgi:predicted nucleic acid-binding protein
VTAKIVVDTSVLIKWIKRRDEELRREALALLGIIQRRPLEVTAPALLLYEVGNLLLWKTQLDSGGVAAALEQILDLPITIVNPEAALLRRAARLGRELRLTFYDSSFLALAEELDCLLITADRKLFDTARVIPRVRHLSAIGSIA